MTELLSRFLSFSVKLIWKMSPLVLDEKLGVFVNTLTADGKYPVQVCENLQVPIQMQLSEKRETFSWFLVPFLESRSNFKHLEKNMIVTLNVFLILQTVKILVRRLSKKRRFGTRFDSEHVKTSQMLPLFSWERFRHVFLSFSGKLISKMSPLVLG